MFLHEFIHLFVVDSFFAGCMLFRASSASSRTDDVYYVIFVMKRSEMEKDIVLSAQMTIDYNT